jgi:putative ABC transport system substrate-binding protein
MGIQLIERHVTSDEELQNNVRTLKDGEADAYLAVSDPIASNQSQVIIEAAITKRLPTMFDFLLHVTKGGLSSYTVSLHEVGRLSAKYVQRVLAGMKPSELPVQGVDKIELVLNLKTAKQIGLTIPPNVLARADRVIR